MDRETAAMIQEAKNTYESSKNRLMAKADKSVVAEVVAKPNVWVATDRSRKTTAKIGEYESLQAARHAVELRFGLAHNG